MSVFNLLLEIVSFNSSKNNREDFRKPLKEKIVPFIFSTLSILSSIFIVRNLKEINNFKNTIEFVLIASGLSLLVSLLLFLLMLKTKIINQLSLSLFALIAFGLLSFVFCLSIFIYK